MSPTPPGAVLADTPADQPAATLTAPPADPEGWTTEPRTVAVGLTAYQSWDPVTGQSFTILLNSRGESFTLPSRTVAQLAREGAGRLWSDNDRHEGLMRRRRLLPTRWGLVAEHTDRDEDHPNQIYRHPDLETAHFGTPYVVWDQEDSRWTVRLARLEEAGDRRVAHWDDEAAMQTLIEMCSEADLLVAEVALQHPELVAVHKEAYDAYLAARAAGEALLDTKVNIAACKRLLTGVPGTSTRGSRYGRIIIAAVPLPGVMARKAPAVVVCPPRWGSIRGQQVVPQEIRSRMAAAGYTSVGAVLNPPYHANEAEVFSPAPADLLDVHGPALRQHAGMIIQERGWGSAV